METEEDTSGALPAVRSPGEDPDAVGDSGRVTELGGALNGVTPVSVPAVEPEEELDDQDNILWHSNAPWVGTGYGTQTALFGPKIAERLGYRLAFSAYYGLQLGQLGWVAPTGKPYTIYPKAHDPFGNDVLGAHAKHWFGGGTRKGGLVVSLMDPWALDPRIMVNLPMLAWTPVDHAPLIPRTKHWYDVSGAIPLAMSQFGRELMLDARLDPLYAPHGFDPNTFFPAERKAARKMLNVPQDAFIVGVVAANHGIPSRKCFAQMLSAFAEFKRTVGHDAILFLHTRLQVGDGEDLVLMCKDNKIIPLASDQYALALGPPHRYVAALMNCFDVLLNTSSGEGFGVPLVEAQACGTPCIVTDFSAMPEVAPAEAGNWIVTGEKLWTGFRSYQKTPHVEAIVAALVQAYEEAESNRLARRAAAAAWATKEYTVDHVVDTYWKPVLQEAIIRANWKSKEI
jgi:glycosyltransferase involved in cell wall biosynthesis